MRTGFLYLLLYVSILFPQLLEAASRSRAVTGSSVVERISPTRNASVPASHRKRSPKTPPRPDASAHRELQKTLGLYRPSSGDHQFFTERLKGASGGYPGRVSNNVTGKRIEHSLDEAIRGGHDPEVYRNWKEYQAGLTSFWDDTLQYSPRDYIHRKTLAERAELFRTPFILVERREVTYNTQRVTRTTFSISDDGKTLIRKTKGQAEVKSALSEWTSASTISSPFPRVKKVDPLWRDLEVSVFAHHGQEPHLYVKQMRRVSNDPKRRASNVPDVWYSTPTEKRGQRVWNMRSSKLPEKPNRFTERASHLLEGAFQEIKTYRLVGLYPEKITGKFGATVDITKSLPQDSVDHLLSSRNVTAAHLAAAGRDSRSRLSSPSSSRSLSTTTTPPMVNRVPSQTNSPSLVPPPPPLPPPLDPDELKRVMLAVFDPIPGHRAPSTSLLSKAPKRDSSTTLKEAEEMAGVSPPKRRPHLLHTPRPKQNLEIDVNELEIMAQKVGW